MRWVRILITLLVASFLVVACSSSGKGGKGMHDDGMGEGNIPLAEAAGQLPDVNFAYDSSSLNSHSQTLLRQNAEWLRGSPGEQIVIEGHCDERGTNEYNMALGERRARTTYDYLVSLGVTPSQLSTISYGEELPLDAGHGEGSWAKNRRAHFAIR